MSDHTPFESRLASALQRRADQAPTEVDAYSVAHAVATARVRPSAGAGIFGLTGWGTARLLLAAAVLTLLAAAGVVLASQLLSPAPALGRLVPAGTMTTGRGGQTATLLHDGRVLLVAGDVNGPDGNAAELYDPATGGFTRTGSISTLGRGSAAAALLPDGRVLLVGGSGQLTGDDDPAAFKFAELYDPKTGTFSRTANMVVPRFWLWSALSLPDGRVVIAGGESLNGILGSIELFDPTTDTFVPGGVMLSQRTQQTMTLLPDGRVLIAGGWSTDGPLATAEIYDPATRTSIPTGELGTARAGATAALLPNGRVLIAGGAGPGTNGKTLASAELFDPSTGTFRPTGSMLTDRSGAASVRLRDGRVLVAGGYNADGDPRTVELYDPAAGEFAVVGKLTPTNSSLNPNWLTTTLLGDGSVLIAGRDIATTERFDPVLAAEPVRPAVSHVTPVGFTAVDGPGALRTGHTATRLADGRILIAGGTEGGTAPVLDSAEIFDPATGGSSPTGSMGMPRSGHVAALLPDGRVLIAGGLGDTDHTQSWSAAELYDPATGTFSPTGLMTTSTPRRGPHASVTSDLPSAITLPDGRVLIVGWDPSRSDETPAWTLRVYDPATGAVTQIDAPEGRPSGGAFRSATLLPDGRALILDGYFAVLQARVYDPVADTWTLAGTTAARDWFTTTLLADGRVLITGGGTGSCRGCHDYQVAASAEVWDPVRAVFSSAGDMAVPRDGHTGTLLWDGRVLVTGGHWDRPLGDTWRNDFPAPEIWDPASSTFSPAGTMAAQRSGHTATALDDGRVLLVGGVTRSPDRTDPVPPFAELYVGH